MAQDRRVIFNPLDDKILFDATNLRVLSIGSDARSVRVGNRIAIKKDSKTIDMGYGWKIVNESDIANIIDEGGQLCLMLY